MSLKEDFLEALRSVKRDFIKNSDPIAQPDTPAPVENDLFRPVVAFDQDKDNFGDTQPSFESAPSASSYGGYTPPAQEPEASLEEEVSFDAQPEHGSDFFAESAASAYSSYQQPSSNERSSYTDSRSIVDSLIPDSAYDDNKTVISKGTVIRGALQTEDSVRLLGQILGDIDCKSNVLVAGKVRGNTTAANAYIVGAQVDGDVRCDDIINIDNSAWVLGNIKALQAEVEGKIKGNLDIRNSLSIGSSSSILGNISTDEIEIKRGAFVNGQIMMYSPPRDMLDRFEQIKEN
ncbi:polymer-forming cytoskeletal protein [Oscillospiraceae bacterium MB08-C2-2]|nr:polymer-forming cytoskeletal protein [Oscillospiraceae bacterium MB08-C2-2]